MFAHRFSKEYENGVEEFVKFVVKHVTDRNRIIRPCLGCCYGKRVNGDLLQNYLLGNEIDRSYTCWTMHGEMSNNNVDLGNNETSESNEFDTNTFYYDRVDEIVDVVEEGLRDYPEMFERLVSDYEKPLYDGCIKFIRMSAVLKLYNIKAKNGWSDKSFIDLLTLLKTMLSEDNVLPNRNYEAKKMLCSIGISYERIYTCPNNCILFRNEYASLNECLKCNVSRYKKQFILAKVVWYLPLIPRFKRMFSSEVNAKHLTWHIYDEIRDGKFRHPVDSPQ